jgi:hypothetical protein
VALIKRAAVFSQDQQEYVLVVELVGWGGSSKSEGSIWDKSPFGTEGSIN